MDDQKSNLTIEDLALNFYYENEISNSAIGSDWRKLLRFILVWMKINQIYNELYFNEKDDKNKLWGDEKKFCEWFKSQNNIKEYIEENKVWLLNEFRSAGFEIGDTPRIKVVNLKNPRHSVKLSDINWSVEQISKVIYQIRCNLFHGGRIDDIGVDLPLVRWSYGILVCEMNDDLKNAMKLFNDCGIVYCSYTMGGVLWRPYGVKDNVNIQASIGRISNNDDYIKACLEHLVESGYLEKTISGQNRDNYGYKLAFYGYRYLENINHAQKTS